MINKRFLAPVLALAALSLPAGASVVEYCSGSGCGVDTQAAFTTVLATDSYTLQGLTDFSGTDLSGDTYTDSASQVVFTDFEDHNMTVSGGNVLSTPYGDDSIVITLPETVVAIALTIDVTEGLCGNDCVENETTGFLGFVNSDPTAPWQVSISPLNGGGYIEISNFNVATAGGDSAPGSTPEVSTLLLIGFGLLSMRWMRRAQRRLFRSPQPAC